MKQIHITRDKDGNVTFETVAIDPTENVFFTNQDKKAPHWPTLISNQLGPAPSPNSSQAPVPRPAGKKVPYRFTYKCKIKGHSKERGIIKVFAQLAAIAKPALKQAIKGKKITPARKVVVGGMSPYVISGEQYQVLDGNNQVIKQGSGSIGPDLVLKPSRNNTGISLTGTPTLKGTYQFTFEVNDGMGANLQQVQYSMKVR